MCTASIMSSLTPNGVKKPQGKQGGFWGNFAQPTDTDKVLGVRPQVAERQPLGRPGSGERK